MSISCLARNSRLADVLYGQPPGDFPHRPTKSGSRPKGAVLVLAGESALNVCSTFFRASRRSSFINNTSFNRVPRLATLSIDRRSQKRSGDTGVIRGDTGVIRKTLAVQLFLRCWGCSKRACYSSVSSALDPELEIAMRQSPVRTRDHLQMISRGGQCNNFSSYPEAQQTCRDCRCDARP
jgi:hypothetical protein